MTPILVRIARDLDVPLSALLRAIPASIVGALLLWALVSFVFLVTP